MDLSLGFLRRSRSQSPVRGIKNKVLAGDELMCMLESDMFSSEEEFVDDSYYDYTIREVKEKLIFVVK